MDALLLGLLEEYHSLIEKEMKWRGHDAGSSERPEKISKAELERAGIMLRKKMIEAEKDLDANYWGHF